MQPTRTQAARMCSSWCTLGWCQSLDFAEHNVGLEQGGEQLALYEGHKHESYKLDCCLTPSDGHVICGSEDGARRHSVLCYISVSCCY